MTSLYSQFTNLRSNMPTKHVVEFVGALSPIANHTTKFGGQPVWVSTPQWPLSRETGNPMRFIGQVRLSETLGLNAAARMAYLFMTEEEDGEFVDGTWEPDGGENAVILQPGLFGGKCDELATGPTLYKMVKQTSRGVLEPEPCEYGVVLNASDDVPYVSEADRSKLSEEKQGAVTGTLDESKIGGTPVFMQGDEIPFGDGWQLLLQLDSCSVPFYVNFGDAGIGYAFMNADGTEAKFLWQCG